MTHKKVYFVVWIYHIQITRAKKHLIGQFGCQINYYFYLSLLWSSHVRNPIEANRSICFATEFNVDNYIQSNETSDIIFNLWMA